MEAPFFVALTQAAWAGLLGGPRPARGRDNGRGPSPAPRYPSLSERGYGYVERDARSVIERIG